jgi:hypothetical protein
LEKREEYAAVSAFLISWDVCVGAVEIWKLSKNAFSITASAA